MAPLKGKVVLVTGGARRLGRAMALDLAQQGADVAITFMDSDREARKAVVEITGLGVRGVALHCDVRDEVSIKAMIAEVKRELGGIDILVNNAANYETVDIEKITVEQWDDIFARNARGPFLVSRAALKELRKRKGRIINLGSLGGLKPWTSHAHYCSSKAALHMLSEIMAKAWAPDVAVNCVAPGMIDLKERKSDTLMRFATRTPMKRNGSAGDVVAAVRFLATSPSFITGQLILVDGGLSLT